MPHPDTWLNVLASELLCIRGGFFIDLVCPVAYATNFISREVLGAIGMREAESFVQHDHRMLLFESVSER